jgi:hypothetical protein
VIGLLRKLRSRSFAELRERAAQKASALLEARGIGTMSREPSDAELARQLAASAPATAKSTTLLSHFRTRREPRFLEGIRDGATAAALRTPRWLHERASLVAAAERVLAGSHDLLGHEGLRFGTPIDWHLDPTTGRRSPRTHWSRIPYLDVDVVGDHKVVWEINRHQHFVVLGRAYQVTSDARYARCFVDQIASWLEVNPPKQGVNWASSLEVAYRAISWLWALELFRDAEELDEALVRRVIKSLHVHGRHVERYLSTYFSANTHLTGEALALLYLGTMLPELARSRRWRDLGWRILEHQLFVQVYDDGVYFEQATAYHRYTLDIYLHAFLLRRAAGHSIPGTMAERLAVAAEHLEDLMRPDGTIPLIGDDDGGQLTALEQREHADVRAALGVASVVLERPHLARVAGGATEEALWLLGPEGASHIDKAASQPPPAHTSRLFPVGGFAVMREGWQLDANHAVIDFGPHGVMNAGHAHADALSIEIAVHGRAAIVDPGTYTYTGSAADRDHFRHSASHNTVTVDGETSSVPAGAFSWYSQEEARLESWWTGTIADSFVGVHEGFKRLADPVVHRRRVLFVRDGYWVIVDSMLAQGTHESVAHLHLVSSAIVTATSARSAMLTLDGEGGARRLLIAAAGDANSLTWTEDWVSPVYGKRERAPVARIRARRTGRCDLVTIVAAITGAVAPVVSERPCEGGFVISVERNEGRDTLLLRHTGVLRVDDIEVDADAALVRRDALTGAPSHVVLFGEAARMQLGDSAFRANAAAEFRRTADGWVVIGDGSVTPVKSPGAPS